MTLLLLLALAAELALLLGDFWRRPSPASPGGKGAAESVAELVRARNEVRVREDGSLSWLDAASGQLLTRRQSVLTLERGRAEIAFLDGTGLVVDESSLVHLERVSDAGNQRIVVTLLRGKITKAAPRGRSEIPRGEAPSTPELEIRAPLGGISAVIPPQAEFQLEAPSSPGAPAKFSVQNGEVQVRTSQGEVKAASGQAVTVGEGVAPELGRAELQAASHEPMPELAPSPLYPPDGAELPASASPQLSWEPLQGVASYELELPGGEVVGTARPYHRLGPVAPGAHSWRVRGKWADGSTTPWSDERSWKAVQPRISLPPPASLGDAELEDEIEGPKPASAPEPGAFFQRWLDWIPSAHAAGPDGRHGIKLSWSQVEGATGYKIQVARDRTFTKVIAEAQPSDPTWTWRYSPGMENSKGRVFYRVATVGEGGVVGEFSAPKAVPIPVKLLSATRESPAREPREPQASRASRPPPVQPLRSAPSGAVALEEFPALERAGVGGAQAPEPEVVQAAPPLMPVSPATPFGPEPRPTLAPAGELAAEAATEAVAHDPNAIRWLWRAGAGLSAGDRAQSSATTDLASVRLSTLLFKERVELGLDAVRDYDLRFRLSVLAELARYSDPAARANGQPTLLPLAVRAQGMLRWDIERTPWRLLVGAHIERDYRFEKTGPQTVAAAGGFSLGPAVQALRSYPGGSFMAPVEAGVALELPLTGTIGASGAFGARALLHGSWQISYMWLVRAEAGGSYLRWSRPAETAITEWSAAVSVGARSR